MTQKEGKEQHLPPRMDFSAQEANQACQELRKVYPWGASTARREKIVKTLLRTWIRTTQGPPAGAFYMLVLKGYCPTTVLGLYLTAQRLYPMLKKTGKWDTLLVWLRIKAATHAAKQAVPAKPAEVLLLREVLPHNLAAAATFLFLTASRYADLRCMVMRSVWKQVPHGSLVIRVDLPIWKSDRYGRRFFSKTFQLPHYLTLGDIRTLVQTPPDYWRLLQAIKEIAPQLSVHSLRRGAVTTLAPSFEGQEILLLTGHATAFEPREVRRYTDPTPHSKEAMLQRRMVNHLVAEMEKASTARQLNWEQ